MLDPLLDAAQKRVLEFLRLPVKLHGPELKRSLLPKRDVEMEAIFIWFCQEEEFIDEIRCLNEGRCLTIRKSIIYKCSPYLDPVGVLRKSELSILLYFRVTVWNWKI